MKLFLHNCGANTTMEKLGYGGHILASTSRISSLKVSRTESFAMCQSRHVLV